jgi:hypothetical protein
MDKNNNGAMQIQEKNINKSFLVTLNVTNERKATNVKVINESQNVAESPKNMKTLKLAENDKTK